MSLIPYKLLRDSIRAIPAMKYALAVAGIGAVVAIVLGLRLSPQVAVFGALIVLGFMFCAGRICWICRETGQYPDWTN
jgi:apolipoprotein N-acyltransferase